MSSTDRPLECLYERHGLPTFGLTKALAERYAGDLGFTRPRLFANFVTALDGTVALAASGDSGPIISQHSTSDRFVMGLLRACADAVIVGAGTFRSAEGHLWHADTIYPDAAPLYAATRAQLGLSPQPRLVLITRSGQIDVSQPAIHDAWIVTSREVESSLRARVPASARVIGIDSVDVSLTELIALLHREGLRLLLSEGGPSLFAQLVAEKLIDELFLTTSPALFGRYPGDHRKSLAAGIDLAGAALELLSVKRDASHLFLRYAFVR